MERQLNELETPQDLRLRVVSHANGDQPECSNHVLEVNDPIPTPHPITSSVSAEQSLATISDTPSQPESTIKNEAHFKPTDNMTVLCIQRWNDPEVQKRTMESMLEFGSTMKKMLPHIGTLSGPHCINEELARCSNKATVDVFKNSKSKFRKTPYFSHMIEIQDRIMKSENSMSLEVKLAVEKKCLEALLMQMRVFKTELMRKRKIK